MLIPQMKRRSLLTGLASLSATSLFPLKEVVAAVNAAANDIEKITWSACTVNCGSRCPVRVVSKNGQVIVSKRNNTRKSLDSLCRFREKDFPPSPRLYQRPLDSPTSLLCRTLEIPHETRRWTRRRQVRKNHVGSGVWWNRRKIKRCEFKNTVTKLYLSTTAQATTALPWTRASAPSDSLTLSEET